MEVTLQMLELLMVTYRQVTPKQIMRHIVTNYPFHLQPVLEISEVLKQEFIIVVFNTAQNFKGKMAYAHQLVLETQTHFLHHLSENSILFLMAVPRSTFKVML